MVAAVEHIEMVVTAGLKSAQAYQVLQQLVFLGEEAGGSLIVELVEPE